VPSGRVLLSVVEDAVFDDLKHHAIFSLDLVVAPWVGYRGVVDVDEVVLTKILEVRPCKGLTQVGDDPVRYPELIGDVLDELCGLFRHDCGDGVELNPLGEFVHHHQDVLVASRGRLEWSHHVKAPYGKGSEWWNYPQNLSRDVLLLGEELATFAPPN
jgi:hypothetical protein